MSNGTGSILPASLKDVWDQEAAESFGKLSMDHQSLVLAYLTNRRNAAKAYLEAYKGRGDEKFASAYGSRIINRDDVQAFLKHFQISKQEAIDKVAQVYIDAMEAETGMIVEGVIVPGTERPDHDMRVKAGKEYAKLRGINAPEEIAINPSEEFRKLWGAARQ